jgi:ABC-type siderophore export system fused ATPase/permease subunit
MPIIIIFDSCQKLSFEESFQIIDEWLKKCALKRELDFNPKTLINIALVTAYKKQISPMRVLLT